MKTLFLGLVSFVLCGTDVSSVDEGQQAEVYNMLRFGTFVETVNKTTPGNLTVGEVLYEKKKGNIETMVFPIRHEIKFIEDSNNKMWCVLPFTGFAVEESECYKFIGNYIIGSTMFLNDSIRPSKMEFKIHYNSNIGVVKNWAIGVEQ
jgi:hypothetical protein